MIATWPPSLPHPERETWQQQPQESRRKRQSDAGPPGYRRRFSSVADMVTLSVVLTHGQRVVFDKFYSEICKHGTVRFWMPDPSTDGWPLTTEAGVQLTTETGEPLTRAERWLCAWGDQLPTETVLGREFRKSFNVVVLP